MEVEIIEAGWRIDSIIRLRKWLKSGLRAYGIRCKEIRPDESERVLSDRGGEEKEEG